MINMHEKYANGQTSSSLTHVTNLTDLDTNYAIKDNSLKNSKNQCYKWKPESTSKLSAKRVSLQFQCQISIVIDYGIDQSNESILENEWNTSLE